MKPRRYNRLLGVVSIGVVAAAFALATVSAQAHEPPVPPSYGFAAPNAGVPLTSAISYQGRLVQNGVPVNGNCDFIFTLYDASSGGAQIGGAVNQTLQVQQGLFSTGLDFGAGAYTGPMRWLSTQVRCPTNSGAYVTLTQRQPLLPAAYAQSLAAFTTQAGPSAPSVLGNPLSNTLPLTVSGGFIGSGVQNEVLADYATVSGGELNTASSRYAVAGGYGNTAGGDSATVAGGGSNRALATFATVGGGHQNLATNFGATVGGGTQNNASGQDALVSGGHGNEASNVGATAGGGQVNKATGQWATVGGGYFNTASIDYAVVGGGQGNAASGPNATVSGGSYNTASGLHATAGGGNSNMVTGWYATVGGGRANSAGTSYTTVGGGLSNTASANYAAVGGGLANAGTGWYAAVGGGYSNTASGWWATAGGGQANMASGQSASVSGGYSNTASASHATVGGGAFNTASATDALVGGGNNNAASGTNATISGGWNNTASGGVSTVGGGYDNFAGTYYATVPGGAYAAARDYGQLAFASGGFVDITGTAQYGLHVLRGTSQPNGAWFTLFADAYSQQISVPPHSAQTFHILVTGLTSDYYVGSWEFRGVIKNTGGSLSQGCATATCIPTPPVKTVLQALPTGEDVSVEADGVNNVLTVKVKGNVYTSMHWVATVQVSEVGW